MQPNQNQRNNNQTDFAENDVLNKIRRRRVMQICSVTAIGLILSLLVARGITVYIFAAGLCGLILALSLAYKNKVTASAYALLSSMSAMLFAFALTGAGLFDIAILGYPCLLIFAAILGGVALFTTVLSLVLALCVFLAWLTLQGHIAPHVPYLTWSHLIFILVILIVTGFSVYVLVRDIKQLMLSLQRENAKVQSNRARIQHLAHHDTLTNLPNRFYGEKLFVKLLDYCEQHQLKLALLFIDLDNFKPVNDALGHAAGDDLLEQLTKRLSENLKENQHLIRFGGDEFLVLTPFSDLQTELDPLASNLIHQCASVFEILHNQVVVSASLGIACAPQDGKDFKQLCRRADLAMYQAKQNGRNTYYYYDESLDKASDDKFKLLQLMRPAIRDQQFTLYYQPMVDLKLGKITTVEALLRWPQSDGSLINPVDFIPIAESGGLINELGRWVIQQACIGCAQLRQLGFIDLRIAVNLSVMQFKDGELKSVVEAALQHAQLPPDALELELTESLLIDDTDQIPEQLCALNKMGITIAIDDFGTGYSNLGYLRKFNASKLKIDRSFIRSLCHVKNDESLVKAIINMAASLDLKTVAEGIEDKATLNKLVELGCDIGQGFYWSKPVPQEQLPDILKNTLN